MWQQYFDRYFPINIERKQDVLIIEDRRPSNTLLVSVTLAALACFIFAVLFRPLISGGIYWLLILFLLPIPVFGVRSLLLPFREKYVFNKDQGTYTFTQQGVLKRQTADGALSQIRAVQMERVIMGDGTKDVYRVALLLRQGLLLGSSDTMTLREQTPVGSRYESESGIAYAIADFLQVPVPEMVSV